MKRLLIATAVAALVLPALVPSNPAAARPVQPTRTPVEVAPAPASPLPHVAPTPVAPNFTLQDQTGHAVSLIDFTGKVVVLEWINYQCPFVKFHAAAGTMRSLAEKYKAQGVVWLGINSTKTATRAKDREWIEQNKLPYPVLEDFEGTIGHAYGAKTTPHMFVINKEGRIVYQGAIDDDRRIEGKATVNYVDQALTALLAGKPIAQERTEPYGCSVKYRGAPETAPGAKPKT